MGMLDRFKRKPDAEIQALVAQLGHADWQARCAAAEALGNLGARAETAVPQLEEAISDENGEVCLAASDALSKIRRAVG